MKFLKNTQFLPSPCPESTFENTGCYGFLSKFLEAKLNNDDSNELGFSDPISNSMLIVLMKILKKNANQRERIWLVNEENGERQILWWSAMKIARQRNIDLKSILK